MKHLTSALVLVFFMAISCGDSDQSADSDGNTNPPPPTLSFTVVKVHPHDTSSFTQGLSSYNQQLYESTGNINTSWLGPLDLGTGRIDKKVNLPAEFFGEGNTVLNGKIYQLTWTNHKGFVYDLKTFKKLREFTYDTEGWGLTNDGKHLIMSGGTSELYYLDPETLQRTKTLTVTDNLGPVPNLNELEFIEGYVYANQWQTSYILKIDTANGNVVGRLNFRDVQNQLFKDDASFSESEKSLNGIAYDSTTGKIFVTGKKWPALYEIKL